MMHSVAESAVMRALRVKPLQRIDERLDVNVNDIAIARNLAGTYAALDGAASGEKEE